MKRLIVLVCCLTAGPTFAQQQSSPNEQALGRKLFQEMQLGVSCSAELIAVKAELDKANARIKELEPKAKSEKK